ncbi:dihydrofolate reductase family protein [Sphingosinicella sp. CPCC 101087]|uniref:dihydrofolate reductase family protein n=1 Tax=Sphingosinicella sp. CPCC 101087 TaxID=2497754 RepID=UPI00101BD435|nr:dihydrofolate reductase family protein [Sphingosinicella sp. CPCC 101087]
MAGRLVVTDYVSLDGVIEDPVGMEDSGLGDWTGPYSRGEEGDAFKHRELEESGAILLGRRTYEAFAAVWPMVKTEFADRMNSLPKYVASTTLERADWSNSTVLRGDIVDDVRKVKAATDGDILVYGSASVAHALMPHGLIDEFRLMVYPVVLGAGKRLFPDGVKAAMKLVECRPFASDILLLRYETA